jgi:hypothetical protein
MLQSTSSESGERLTMTARYALSLPRAQRMTLFRWLKSYGRFCINIQLKTI